MEAELRSQIPNIDPVVSEYVSVGTLPVEVANPN